MSKSRTTVWPSRGHIILNKVVDERVYYNLTVWKFLKLSLALDSFYFGTGEWFIIYIYQNCSLLIDEAFRIFWIFRTFFFINSNFLSANPIKWSNTLKQFVGNLPTNCLSVFDHFMGLALKGLIFLKRPTDVYSTVKKLLLNALYCYI